MDREKKKGKEAQNDLAEGLILDDEWINEIQGSKGRNKAGEDSQEMIDDALFMP